MKKYFCPLLEVIDVKTDDVLLASNVSVKEEVLGWNKNVPDEVL